MKPARPLWFLAAPLLAALPVAAADLRPSWECLPEKTAVMVRLQQPREFVEALKTRTRFGATMLGEQRLQKIGGMVLDQLRREGGGEAVDGMESALAKYGLMKEDLAALFAGDMGFGLVIRRRDGRPPLKMLLGWLEPGAGPAERLVAAGKTLLVERQAEGAAAPRRIDLEMAGHEVMWVQEPVMLEGLVIEVRGGDGEGVKARVKEAEGPIKADKSVQTGLAHSFMTRIGGRLLLGQTIPVAAADRAGDGAAGGDRDWEAESGTDEAKAMFLRFLADHEANGPAPLAGILGLPGVRNTLPGGTPLIDMIVDPQGFRGAFAAADNEESRAFRQKLGVDEVGPFAWRQTLDGGTFQQGMFLGMPGPRRGVLQILDQKCDPSEPPPFASREAVSLVQISLDLGKAYQTLREVLSTAFGEEVTNMFTVAEVQAQGNLGIELPKFLSALGSRHWIVDYPPRIAEAMAAGRQAGAVGDSLQNASRGGFVWQLTDEAPFRKALQQLAPLSGGAVQDEQGFAVVRAPNTAIAIGMNHLVVAIGDEALERTLAGIRNPPAGDASLREGAAMRRAATLMPLDPARMFAVGDAARTGGILGILRQMAAGMEPDDVPEKYRPLLRGIQDVMPTAPDMEGMFGVSAATMRMTDDGLVLRSAWEMPPP